MNSLPLPTVEELTLKEFYDALPFRCHIYVNKLPEYKQERDRADCEKKYMNQSKMFRLIA